MRLARLAVPGLALAILACGCATPEPPKEEPRSEPRRESKPPEPIVQAGRYLIYPMKWLRAEEAAETLRPILESRYGPGVNIVPHIPTNKLIIYIPSQREQEMVRGQGGAGVPAQTAPRMQTPGAQTRGTGPGSTTSGTQTSSRRRSTVTGSR